MDFKGGFILAFKGIQVINRHVDGLADQRGQI